MSEPFSFLAHEIGSLAKPPWLVKTSQGRELDASDIEHARSWGEKVGVEGHEELVESLQKGGADPDEVARWSSRYCVHLQESAGLDVISVDPDGCIIDQPRAPDERGDREQHFPLDPIHDVEVLAVDYLGVVQTNRRP